MTEETTDGFDAYQTAKPNEPTFTLQGGDPLAPPLVLQWAQDARKLGLKLQDEGDEVQSNLLLVKATAAEQVAWSMQAYQKGEVELEGVRSNRANEDDPALALQCRDLHDFRVWAAGRISNAFSEVNDIIEKLKEYGWTPRAEGGYESLHMSHDVLKQAHEFVLPKRGRKEFIGRG